MKLGFALGPCVRDILLDNVKDEDVGFILVDDGFEWNSQPDGVDLIMIFLHFGQSFIQETRIKVEYGAISLFRQNYLHQQ